PAQYGQYIPVHQVTGMRTARYRVVTPKIGRRRPIEGEIDHRRSIEGEKGKKKKRKRRKKKKRRRTYFPRDILALARGCFFSRAGRHSSHATSSPSPAGAFSPARGDGMSPRAGRKIETTI
ncbi:hypothetical protein GW17_00004948, partial [Ensete ventricosum]